MSRWPSPISAASSTWHAPSPDIWFPSPRPREPRFAPASTESSTPCSSLNMCSKCSGVPCPLALHALRWPASPIASSKSLPKHANSPQPKIGHRLAGYVGYLEVDSGLCSGRADQTHTGRGKMDRSRAKRESGGDRPPARRQRENVNHSVQGGGSQPELLVKPRATQQGQHRESGSRVAHELDLHRTGLVLLVEGGRRPCAIVRVLMRLQPIERFHHAWVLARDPVLLNRQRHQCRRIRVGPRLRRSLRVILPRTQRLQRPAPVGFLSLPGLLENLLCCCFRQQSTHV